MDKKIKRSVATLLAHIIKIDHRDIEKHTPIFCDLIGANFGCTKEEARSFLEQTLQDDYEYDIDEHLEVINQAVCDDRLCKMHILDHLNRIICTDTITPKDYEEFERIKRALLKDAD